MSGFLCYVIETIEQICIIGVTCRENEVEDCLISKIKVCDIEYYFTNM